MINFLNQTLRRLFVGGMGSQLDDESQVSFEFPDQDFRSHLRTMGRCMLNVCLVDLKENRNLSTTTPAAVSKGVTPLALSFRRRVDCHYLISAWSPATRSAEPTLDEHALLYDAMTLLVEAEPLVPRKAYGLVPMPRNFPLVLCDAELPSAILPAERFAKIAEFWSAASGVHWRPTIHLVVTLPVINRVTRGVENSCLQFSAKIPTSDSLPAF